jgi:glycosyltransferase involved in cell wall biosynthesis
MELLADVRPGVGGEIQLTDALDAVLAGLAAQSGVARDDWEVIVADDGSGPATREVIERWQARFPCALRHVWHEDTGFRHAADNLRTALQRLLGMEGAVLAGKALHQHLGIFVDENTHFSNPLGEAVKP